MKTHSEIPMPVLAILFVTLMLIPLVALVSMPKPLHGPTSGSWKVDVMLNISKPAIPIESIVPAVVCHHSDKDSMEYHP